MTAIVQHKHAEVNSATSLACVLDSVPSPGNLLIAYFGSTANVGTSTFPWGSTTPDVSIAAVAYAYAFSKIAGASESQTISATIQFSRGLTLDVYEVAPTPGRTWVGFDKGASNSAATVTSLLVGPTAAQTDSEDFTIAGMSLSSTPGSVGALSDSYVVATGTTSNARAWSGYKVLGSNAAVQCTGSWGVARNVSGLIATYKQTGTATPPNTTAMFLPLI